MGGRTIVRPELQGGATVNGVEVINASGDVVAPVNPGDLVVPQDQILVGNSSGVGAAVAMSGDATIVASGALTIANSAITNAKVSASAAIAFSKLASLPSADILVGNVSNVATAVAMSGDATLDNAGVLTIGAAKVTGAKLSTAVGYFQVAKATNGTTPVNVIAATVPFTCTITGVYVISLDTTAGNITIADTAGTVATIAKGTVSGVMVGAASLANTTVTSGNTFTIVSSSAGNANVFITFTVA